MFSKVLRFSLSLEMERKGVPDFRSLVSLIFFIITYLIDFGTCTCAYQGVGKKCLFSGKFGVLCFLETPVLRLALLPCYWRNEIFRSSWALPLISMAGRISIKQTHLSLSLSFLSEWLSLSTSYSFKFEFLKYYPGLYQERGAPTRNKDSYDLEQGPLIQSLLQGDNT